MINLKIYIDLIKALSAYFTNPLITFKYFPAFFSNIIISYLALIPKNPKLPHNLAYHRIL